MNRTSPEGPFDVIVVGGGAAGLRAAIAAAKSCAATCLLACDGGATVRSTADYSVPDDRAGSSELRRQILEDSCGLADETRVTAYCDQAQDRLDEIVGWGAGPSVRIGPGDFLVSGKRIHRALRREAQKSGVFLYLNTKVVDLATTEEGVAGVWTEAADGSYRIIEGGSVILATGGYQNIFPAISAPVRRTDFPIAWALRAGAVLKDMEMINFCPMSTVSPGGESSILPYILSNATERASSLSERDKLEGFLSLADTDHGRPEKSRSSETPFRLRYRFTDLFRFAGLLAIFGVVHSGYEFRLLLRLLAGKSVGARVLPHYSCGGIMTDPDGGTGVRGLFACGEVAGGSFGAFRTVSSITDCLVSGMLCGNAAAKSAGKYPMRAISNKPEPDAGDGNSSAGLARVAETALGMWRSADILDSAIVGSKTYELTDTGQAGRKIRDQILVTHAVLKSALLRRDSRGFHVREDFPDRSTKYDGNTCVRLVDGEIVAEMLAAASSKHD